MTDVQGMVDKFKASQLSSQEREIIDTLTKSYLCTQCASIFDTAHPDQWFKGQQPHHSSERLLDEAVQLGCTLCVWVKSAIGTKATWNEMPPKFGQTVIPGLSFALEIDTTGDRFRFSLNGRSILDLQMVNHENIENNITRFRLVDSTKSQQAFDLMNRWVSNCKRDHDRCNSRRNSTQYLPSRLLHIRRIGQAITARLRETRVEAFENPYLTLSHCWGTKEIFCLSTANLLQLRKAVPVHLLPQVFQDAMEVTLALGYEYLWVDSLCICQDSVEDWLHESSNMAAIYQYADCNIAATGFEDGENGLFVERDTEIQYPRKILTKWTGYWGGSYPRRQVFYIINDQIWDEGVSDAPLNKRGWVLQERLLSPRTVHFGNRMIFWECCENSCCELYPSTMPRDILATKVKIPSTPRYRASTLSQKSFFGSDANQRTYLMWHTTVKAYSAGQLTRSSDKTIAISGAAKRFRQILQDQYLAGLWRRNLLRDLLWTLNPSTEVVLHEHWIAPSWSWMSVDASIQYYDGQSGEDAPEIEHATILDASITPIGNDDTGPICGGSLTVEGPLTHLATVPEHMVGYKWRADDDDIRLDITFDIQGAGSGSGVREHGSIIVTATKEAHYSIATYDWLAATLLARRPVYILPLLTDIDWELDRPYMRGLVLGHCEGSKGQFIRIGYFEAKDEDVQHILLRRHARLSDDLFLAFDGASSYTISIV